MYEYEAEDRGEVGQGDWDRSTDWVDSGGDGIVADTDGVYDVIPDDLPDEEIAAGQNSELGEKVGPSAEEHLGALAADGATAAPLTDPERAIQREAKNKIHFTKAFLEEGTVPINPEGQRLIENVVRVGINTTEFDRPDSEARAALIRYLSSSDTDPFAIQEHSEALLSRILQGTEGLDIVDLALAGKAIDNLLIKLVDELPASALERNTDKLLTFQQAVHIDLVQAIAPFKLVGEDIVPMREVCQSLFGEEQGARATQELIRDRLLIGEMVMQGGLWAKPGIRGDSPYSAPPAPEELNRLNRAAAETIERLHLLKAYGIGPFLVSGEQLGLPWDIAVMPPWDTSGTAAIDSIPDRYAEGAVADFMFLDPGERDSIALQREPAADGRTHVTIGGGEAWMRFRLHDNGQITHGLAYHNIPSDNTERAFTEDLSVIAFQRIRALFIALAFDAMVPDEVTRGRDVRGSVASTFRERPNEPVGPRVVEMVLRRQKALRRAQVSPTGRTPEGWQGPKREVGGHFRPLPEGCKARPTAEEEARSHYQRVGWEFPGLREGYNWVNTYYRRAMTEIKYRQARFRRDTATRAVVQGLGGGRRRRR